MKSWMQNSQNQSIPGKVVPFLSFPEWQFPNTFSNCVPRLMFENTLKPFPAYNLPVKAEILPGYPLKSWCCCGKVQISWMIYKPQGTSTVAGCLQAPERVSQLGHTQRCCRAAKVLLKAKTTFNSSIPLLLHAPAPLRKAGILSSHLQSLDLSANLSAAGKMEFYKCLCKILPQLSHTLVLAWPSTYRSQGKDESRLKTLTLCLQ